MVEKTHLHRRSHQCPRRFLRDPPPLAQWQILEELLQFFPGYTREAKFSFVDVLGCFEATVFLFVVVLVTAQADIFLAVHQRRAGETMHQYIHMDTYFNNDPIEIAKCQ